MPHNVLKLTIPHGLSLLLTGNEENSVTESLKNVVVI